MVQYRNRILPLIPLCSVLEPGVTELNNADPLQVIVFNDGDRSVGLVVDQILDVAEDVVTIRQKSARKGLLGSGVVGKRVTDFVDLSQVISVAAEAWFHGASDPAGGKKILVAEASAFSRGLIRNSLDMAGYRVVEAANKDDAIHALEQESPDVVVAALDLPQEGTTALLAAMRASSEWDRVPLVALAESHVQLQASAMKNAGFQDCQGKYDREGMLESVARLASTPLPPNA